MNKKIVLVGKSCSGKSTLANKLNELNLTPQLSTTTRPKRDYEANGIDYNFITKDEFFNLKNSFNFVEWDNFNGWYYGLTVEDYKNADILILTPRGLKKYLTRFGKEAYLIIYLESSTSIRKERIENRGDQHDDVGRRWIADEIDFENIDQWGSFWDIKISIQDNNAIDNLIQILKNK